MKEYTHISMSVGVGLFLLNFYNFFVPLGVLFIFMGLLFGFMSRINDYLDFKLYSEHERKFLTHSPLSPLLFCISVITGALFAMIDIFLGIYVGIIVHILFVLHFLLDALNPSGVPLTPNKRIRLKDIPYDNLWWNIAFFLIGVLLTLSAVLIYALLS